MSTENDNKKEGNLPISVVSNSMISVEYRDLKTEFLAIQNDAIGQKLTMATMEEINRKYYNLFNHFGL